MNGKEAVELLARDPGYFIIGIPARHPHYEVGDRTHNFAGYPLPVGQYLEVEAPTSLKEWQFQQIRLFGKIKVRERGHYYRCRLKGVK